MNELNFLPIEVCKQNISSTIHAYKKLIEYSNYLDGLSFEALKSQRNELNIYAENFLKIMQGMIFQLNQIHDELYKHLF